MPTPHYNQWKKYRSYYIPKKLVNANKKNTLAVRVWDLDAMGGIRYGSVFISNTVFINQLPLQLEGDWLKQDGSNDLYAGLYNNVAVYKGALWNYDNISVQDGIYKITLSNKEKKEYLRITDENGSGNFFFGSDESHMHLCSLRESYNATPDTMAAKKPYGHPANSNGVAHYTGWIKDYSPTLGRELSIQVMTPFSITTSVPDGPATLDAPTAYSIDTYTQMDIKTMIDPDGSFSVDIPHLPGAIFAYLRGINSAVIPVYLETDKTVFQVLDPEEFKIYVTPEWYARERRTLYMGDLTLENRVRMYGDWLATAPDAGKDIWDRFRYTAIQYASSGHVTDYLMNDVVSTIAWHCRQYDDIALLKMAKIWAARVLQTAPENHQYNNTFNVVLQNLGEHLEGLEYLVRALQIAEKDNKPEFVQSYKESIKRYITEMLK